MTTTTFENAIRERILVLDGGFGSMLQKHNLQEGDFRGSKFAACEHNQKGNYDLLNLTQSGIVRDIHAMYYKAGADIVTTNTLNANAVSLAEYGMADMARQINAAAVALARSAAADYAAPDKPRYVALSIGPTSKSLSISPDVERPQYRAITFDTLMQVYYEQIDAAVGAGADLLLMETMFDTLNVKAALFAAMEHRRRTGSSTPIVVSATIADSSGRMLAGQTLEAFLASVSHAPLSAIGLNCALGAAQLKPYVEKLSAIAPFAVSAHPNAGLPREDGGYIARCTLNVSASGGIAVAGVSITNCPSNALAVGDGQYLYATISPCNADNQAVTWTSSNSSVASVNSSGVVTAAAEGTAYIIVSAQDGGYKDSCRVRVVVPVQSVSIANCPDTSLVVGASHPLSKTIYPANAINQNVRWESSGTMVARVSSTGVVTAVRALLSGRRTIIVIMTAT